MARLAHGNPVMATHAHGGGTTVVLCHSACATSTHDCLGDATAALCLEGHTTMANVYVAYITVALCHWAGATSVQGRLGSATVALCPEGCATTAHVYVDYTTVVPYHSNGAT